MNWNASPSSSTESQSPAVEVLVRPSFTLDWKRVAVQSALWLLIPSFGFKCLSLIPSPPGQFAFSRVYLSAMAAVASAMLAIASLTRLRLSWRHALYGFAAIVAFILVVSRTNLLSDSEPRRWSEHLHQSGIVFAMNVALIAGGWFLSQMFARGVKRASYLVLAAIAATIGDMYSVWFGPTGKLVEKHAEVVAPLTMLRGFIIGANTELPVMGVGDLLFLALFLWGARQFGFDLIRNLIAQLIGLGVAYALLIHAMVNGHELRLAGLMFIGPAFLIINWKRFAITRQDWRAIACLVAGLIIAMVSLIVIEKSRAGR